MFTLQVSTSVTSIVQNRFAMRTPHTQNERFGRSILQAEIRNRGFFATALGVLLLFIAMAAAPVLAVDSVWDTNPGSGDWNTAANWVGGIGPPVDPGDKAAFNTSNMTSLSLSSGVTMGLP
jgi:hypothetical protein